MNRLQKHPDICIAGAGIIGLSLALELHEHGAQVTVIERDAPLGQASQAAAGMLAAHDPANPPALLPLAELSLALYGGFLARNERLSGISVPFQTSQTFQSIDPQDCHLTPDADLPACLTPGNRTFTRLAEHSLDPRQLAPALLAAVRATSVRILDHTTLQTVTESANGLQVNTSSGTLDTGSIVYTLGAWSFPPVAPRKGQMLSVRIPPGLALDSVIRTPEVYIVPRLHGPHAGQAVIGATVEDAGFSTSTDPSSLAALRARAANLSPALADPHSAPPTNHWAGHRPHTPDDLPILGAWTDGSLGNDKATRRQFLATGHYRNGILLAPATAHVLARLVAGQSSTIDLDRFAPARFMSTSQDRTHAPIFAHLS